MELSATRVNVNCGRTGRVEVKVPPLGWLWLIVIDPGVCAGSFGGTEALTFQFWGPPVQFTEMGCTLRSSSATI